MERVHTGGASHRFCEITDVSEPRMARDHRVGASQRDGEIMVQERAIVGE